MQQKIVLIMGPSGVGKTEATKLLIDKFPDCVFQDLDTLASKWAVELGLLANESVSQLRNHIGDDQLFLGFGLQAIGVLAGLNPDKHLVIDVGAGFQDAHSAEKLCQIHEVIAITACKQKCHERISLHRADSRTLASYSGQEFSTHRCKVYDQTTHKINTTSHTLQDTADELEKILKTLLPD